MMFPERNKFEIQVWRCEYNFRTLENEKGDNNYEIEGFKVLWLVNTW